MDYNYFDFYFGIPIVFWVIALLVAVGLAFIPASIAKRKGYSYGGFWCLGFFFFLIALIIALCLTDKNQYAQPNYGQPPPPQGYYPPQGYQAPPQYQAPQYPPQGYPAPASGTKFCNKCGNPMNAADSFCGRCGNKMG